MDEGADLDAAKALLHKLPTDLNALFTGILDRDAEDIDRCVELLQWVSFAQTALSPESLYDALRVTSSHSTTPERPDRERLRRFFLHRSRGLLEITRDEHPVVQFIHETVRTFLLTPHGLPRIRPVLAGNITGPSHEMLKQFCLKFIILNESHYEELLPRFYDKGVHYKVVDGDDQSGTDDGAPSASDLLPVPLGTVQSKSQVSKNTSRPMDLYQYAICHIFRHAELAELYGMPQQGSLKVLEEKKLLTILCHCLLLYRSITGSSSALFAIRARENSLHVTANTEYNLVQLVKRMVGTENKLQRFRSAITRACILQNVEIARLIVEGGLKKNYRLVAGIRKYPCFSPAGMTRLLHETIRFASIDEVKVLLVLGVTVDAIDPDPDGFGTALQAAVYSNQKDTFDLLVESGADVNQQAGLYGTALHIAAYQGQMDTVTTLLNLNASVNVQAGVYGTPLQAATYGCHKQIVEVLCKAGSDVNVVAGTYGTALQAAAYRGHQSLIEFLSEVGADVNIQAGKYETALQAAAWSPQGTAAMIRLLLTQGAHIDARAGEYGKATHALWGAALFGSSRYVDMLLRYEAKPPSEGINLRSWDCEQWVWDRFREPRWYLASCYDWLTIHDVQI